MSAVAEQGPVSGAASLAAALAAEGIDTVFGTVGHGNLAFVDALARTPSIRYVPVYHEQVAAHAADAYFRVSGRLAAVTTTVGPGFTNLATGLGDALLDSSAFVVIAGGIPTGYRGKEALQELSLHVDDGQPELYRNLSKRVTRVERAQDLAHELRRSVVRACSGNPGPVILHVPLDLFSAPVEPPAAAPAYRPGRAGPDAEAVRRAAALVAAAERPVLFCGGGALLSDAGEAVVRLAERHGIAVATTMSGQGAIPEQHPLAVGFTGVVGTRSGNEAVKRADLLIAVGTRFPEMDASSWRAGFFAEIPPAQLVHVDVDPNQIGKIYPATEGLVGDARRSLEELLAELDRSEPPARRAWRDEIAELKGAWEAESADVRGSDAFPFEPAALLTELRSLLAPETVLVTGVGVRHAVGQHFPFSQPRTQVVASGFGTMGQEVAAPIGARLARPDVPVVGIVGDGAVLACLAALPSAVANAIDAVWIVLENRGYASIAVYQAKHFAGRFAGTYLQDAAGRDYEIDFAGLARSFGAGAHAVGAPDELAPAVRAALAEPGPSVVVVPVTPKPGMRGSGQWDVNDILALTPDGDVSLAQGGGA